MPSVCQCLELKATVRMSDLEHVILSSHTVFIPLRLVYIKYCKPCTPYTEDDLCQANDRSMLQSQTNTTCIKRDFKKTPRREITHVLTNICSGFFRKIMFETEQGHGEYFPPDALKLAGTFWTWSRVTMWIKFSTAPFVY